MKTPGRGRGFPPRYNDTPDPPGGFAAITLCLKGPVSFVVAAARPLSPSCNFLH